MTTKSVARVSIKMHSGHVRSYHLSERISAQDGYWFVEDRKPGGKFPIVTTFKEAETTSVRSLRDTIGEVGCALIQNLARNHILNHAFAVNIVSGYQVNVLLRPEAELEWLDKYVIDAVGRALKAKIEVD